MQIRLAQYRRFLRTCWHFIDAERRLFVTFVAISVVGALTEGIGISLFVPLIDSMSAKSSFSDIPLLSKISELFAAVPASSRIPLVAAIMFAVVLARGAVQYFTQFLNIYLPVRIEQRLRNISFDCLLHMDLAVVNASRSGEMQNFIAGYPGRIGQVMGYLGNLFSSVAMLSIYAVLMMLISIKLTLVSLVFVGAVFLIQRRVSSGELRRAGAEVSSSGENLTQVVWEMLNGLSLIRLCVAGPLMRTRYTQALASLRAAQTRYAYASALVSPLYGVASGALICILLFSAFAIGKSDADTVAVVLLFLFLLQRLLSPMGTITASRNAILLHMDAMDEFGPWLDRVVTQFQKDGERPFSGFAKSIRFDNVTFSYRADSGDVLKRLSFSIPKNRMVAIVGPSGSGKSTVVSLLGRLYDPQSGAVLVDDRDLREYKVDTWRRRISVVSQNIFLLNDTVERNLTFGLVRPVDELEVRRAAELAACSEFIDSLPHGYQTLLGERGTRLSGGQQQRIAIARAILADPLVLILDEATSHLDSITERAIQKAMNSFRDGRTLIVIAHRMSTIRSADKIIVLADGMVLEQGTHETLMRARGQYWDLIEHQKLDIVDLPPEEMAAS